jgi:hypothetical protein
MRVKQHHGAVARDYEGVTRLMDDARCLVSFLLCSCSVLHSSGSSGTKAFTLLGLYGRSFHHLSIFPAPAATFHLQQATSTEQHRKMAPRLAASQHQMISDMILSGTLTQKQMADTAHCSERGIQRITRNLRLFGTTKAPSNGAGRRRIITPRMLEVLCKYLLMKSGLY